MTQFAMLFPGQGAQSVGMLTELGETDPAIADTWAEAGAVLGYDMAALVAKDADGLLDQTEYTQPALLAANIAVWRAWKARGGKDPAWLAGHSLGEYAALVAAGALAFDDALRLTQLRGRAMQDAVREVCADVSTGDDYLVAPANFNAPRQVVVAGHADAVGVAAERAREQGAKLVKTLAVSVPSHCALMAPAAEQLAAELRDVPLQEPHIPVLHNIDARARDTADGMREALVAQLAQSVLWSDTVRAMSTAGCRLMLECGPGKVLSGLNKRIDKQVQTIALRNADGIHAGLVAV